MRTVEKVLGYVVVSWHADCAGNDSPHPTSVVTFYFFFPLAHVVTNLYVCILARHNLDAALHFAKFMAQDKKTAHKKQWS
jgi:hypothetical protein